MGKVAKANLLHHVHRRALLKTRTGADCCKECQTPAKLAAAVFTSSIVVLRPSDSRTVPSAFSGGMPSASNIAEGSSLSVWQAEPFEASTSGQAARSRRPETPGNRTLSVFGRRSVECP